MRFASPLFLLLLLLLPLIAYAFSGKRRLRGSTLRYSDVSLLSSVNSRRAWLKLRALLGLRLLALLLFILALARPQAGETIRDVVSEGIDIVLTVDISGSMLAEDFKPDNRLTVAKQVVSDFIGGREVDRIGLVAFSAKAFTQCPLTLDYGVLRTFVEKLEVGMIQDGTAIGTAIAASVNRLRQAEGKSRIIILLTDGINNAGNIDPLTAAKLAKSQKIKVYTIGAGKQGQTVIPVNDPVFGKRYVRTNVEIDETTLTKIAEETGGQYFRATDADSLRAIYDQISEMEKTEIKTQEYVEYNERFPAFLAAGLVLLIVHTVLAHTFWRRLP